VLLELHITRKGGSIPLKQPEGQEEDRFVTPE
jgi:hypothetical protein